MTIQSNYRILPELKLIVEYYSGDISEVELISQKDTIRADDDFNVNYNLINDFSDAKFVITDEGIQSLFKWLKTHNSSERKSALLTNTPEQVAKILLFRNKHDDNLPMQINIFSTLSAAINWVDLSFEKEPEINKVLKELKDSVLSS